MKTTIQQHVSTLKFIHKFRRPSQPHSVMVWADEVIGEPKHPRVQELEESGYQVVHVRWPATVLLDFDCDEPHRVAREIAEAVSGYCMNRRTAAEYNEFEAGLLEWLMEHRGESALSAHDD
jgi:hypothetical protein